MGLKKILGPALAVVLLAPRAGLADDPDPNKLASAKNLFRSGVALLATGDYQGALEYFLKSRALVPSIQNTTDAAICLDQLGRYDEALDMYEELLLRFSGDLAEDDKQRLGPVMAALRGRLGAIRVSANVEGRVVIDGRPRGDLPVSTPIRVLGGKHTVRIFRDGYTAFETRVDVPAGITVVVEGRLDPLADAGLLRVEDAASEGFDVFIDGARAGRVPWEGTLPPGRHVVFTRRGDRGSAPRDVEILQGQTVLLRPGVTDLGPPLKISVDPPTARISLDGVPLGIHGWSGRVPLGHHEIRLAEDGYFPRQVSVEVSAASVSPPEVDATLHVDPDHPRWPRPAAGQVLVSVFGGAGGGKSLRSDPGQQGDDAPIAVLIGARGAYRFQNGLAAEVSGGFLTLGATPRTAYAHDYLGNQIVYTIDHAIRARGAFVGVGGSYRLAIRPWLGVSTRITLGLAALRVDDTLSGTAADTAGRRLPIFVAGIGEESPRDLHLFALPEIAADFTWRGYFVGLGLGVAFFPGTSPPYRAREIGVTPFCSKATDLGSVGCAPDVAVPGEIVYRDFLLWMPQLSIGRVF